MKKIYVNNYECGADMFHATLNNFLLEYGHLFIFKNENKTLLIPYKGLNFHFNQEKDLVRKNDHVFFNKELENMFYSYKILSIYIQVELHNGWFIITDNVMKIIYDVNNGKRAFFVDQELILKKMNAIIWNFIIRATNEKDVYRKIIDNKKDWFTEKKDLYVNLLKEYDIFEQNLNKLNKNFKPNRDGDKNIDLFYNSNLTDNLIKIIEDNLKNDNLLIDLNNYKKLNIKIE